MNSTKEILLDYKEHLEHMVETSKDLEDGHFGSWGNGYRFAYKELIRRINGDLRFIEKKESERVG